MKRLLNILFTLLLSLPSVSFSQTFVTSAPEKITNKTPKIAVLGKNSQGILIRKFGNGVDFIECYDDNLNMNWREPIIPKDGDAYVYKMYTVDDNILAFYVKQTKKTTTLYGQVFSPSAMPMGDEVFLDSLSNDFPVLKFQLSADKKKIIAYHQAEDNGTHIKLLLLNDKLEKLFSTKFNFSDDRQIPIESVFVDTLGKLGIITGPDDKAKDDDLKKFSLTEINTGDGSKTNYPIDLDNLPYGEIYFDFDKVSNNLVSTGFFSTDEDNGAEGYFYLTFDLDSNKIKTKKFTRFTDDFIMSLTGKENSKKNPGLYSFDISDVILRYDGGAILVGESQYKSSEQSETNVFVSPTSPGFKSVIYYYYDDIIVLSINADGNEDWRSIIRKKQVSQDDKGFYSSFALMNTNTDLHFIFNEDISRSTNVFDQSLNSEGYLEKNTLFNSDDEELFLAPQLGKQVSSNALIVPSIRKNYLTFVKITY